MFAKNLLLITIEFPVNLVLKSHCYILAHLNVLKHIYFENS